jgi:histidinol-phosphatase (PHP family)
MIGFKINYHTHTARCGHASGTDEDYVRAALANGYTELGFSDHCPWLHASGYVNAQVRMRPEQLLAYAASIRALRDQYAGRIRIGVGLECEHFPHLMGWLRDACAQADISYLILGSHYDLTDEYGMYFGNACCPEDLKLYLKRTIAGMETGLFAYLAHPDLCMRTYPAFDNDCVRMSQELCRAAVSLNMPLEYNLHGIECKVQTRKFRGEGYPCDGFWEIAAREGCTAIIGADAHDPELFDRENYYAAAIKHLSRLGIKRLDKMELFT